MAFAYTVEELTFESGRNVKTVVVEREPVPGYTGVDSGRIVQVLRSHAATQDKWYVTAIVEWTVD